MSKSSQKLSAVGLRAEAAKRFSRIIHPKVAARLDSVLTPTLTDPQQHAWMSAAIYGMCRYYIRYKDFLIKNLDKPFKPNDLDVESLIVLGLHQLGEMKVKDHAAINETVEACSKLNKKWAKGLVNAMLRGYQREFGTEQEQDLDEHVVYAHPKWLLKRLQTDWPDDWGAIAQANNTQAPMTLRVNQNIYTTSEAKIALDKQNIKSHHIPNITSALILEEPIDVQQIPGFNQGHYSVQDASAQLAAELLLNNASTKKNQALETNLKILDACAAPGGKSGHLIELMHPDSELIAVELHSNRAILIDDNLKRINIKKPHQVICADICEYLKDKKKQFDKILLDVPCTASGVIRRHPDIKLRRDLHQLNKITEIQAKMLDSAWRALKQGGQMLYATCSVFKAENHQQITNFLATQDNAKVIPLSINMAKNSEHGSQILPGSEQWDGFFYALLEKI